MNLLSVVARSQVVLSCAIVLHLLEFISIGSANKVALHVIDVSVRVHQVLLVLPLDLDASHHHIVLNVDAFFLLLAFSASHFLPSEHIKGTVVNECRFLLRMGLLLYNVGLDRVLLVEHGGGATTYLVVAVKVSHFKQVIITVLDLLII